MLVLSRKVDESIVLDTSDGPVTVTIVDIRTNGQVRLGIEAPQTMPVHRLEIWNEIRKERRGGGTPAVAKQLS